ncbi:uncharacterized protein LOC131643144 [Vicia villosa]|uniref:uncharacterized protein LOC131643144 n=1 Tax=Vicia villosa TaxID=3911 RepID=UPI00273CDCA7|nr:uncharacterized protein LOC131643144 [Vicia villosa]
MAEGPRNRPLRDYAAPSQQEPHNSIAAPTFNQKDFKLKPSLISTIQQHQFSGNPTEDLNEHLTKFVYMIFPRSKNVTLRAQINRFRQKDTESLFDAWERYKDMMRMCPHHGLEDWLIIHAFYNGLLHNIRLSIDATAGGTLMDKPYDKDYQLIENMALNHYQWGSERTLVEKSQTKGGMYEISSLDKFNAKLNALTQKIDNLTLPPAATVAVVTPNCELCRVPGQAASECQILARVLVDQVN